VPPLAIRNMAYAANPRIAATQRNGSNPKIASAPSCPVNSQPVVFMLFTASTMGSVMYRSTIVTTTTAIAFWIEVPISNFVH
jgi:hypothetical protein